LEKLLSNIAGPERSRQSPEEDRVDQWELVYGKRLLAGGATHRIADGSLSLAGAAGSMAAWKRFIGKTRATGVMFRM